MAPKFNQWERNGNSVSVLGAGEQRPKKLTATRVAAALGYNSWKTDFQVWCEICRVAEPPFEGNKFTEFGKIVEPKLHEFCKEYISPHLQRPVDVYGDKVDRIYDYYPDDPIFGGMWDDRVLNRKGEVIGIVEYKSSSRPQDWGGGTPNNYRLQAMQYAWKEGVDDYWVVCTFPKPEDYENPENYAVTQLNTFIYDYKVSDGFDGFTADELFGKAKQWWEAHVVGNRSPIFNEQLDKAYLDIMRTNEVELSDDINALSAKIAALTDRIEATYARTNIKALETELKNLTDKVFKPKLKELLTEGKTIIETEEWVYKQSAPSTEINKDALEADGLLEQYTVEKQGTWRLTRKKEKKNG